MAKAFSVPLTPQGRSALATTPSWHYSHDCIAIAAQYREAFVLVEAVFDGTPVNYCPYIFADNAAACRTRVSAWHGVLGHRPAHLEELRRMMDATFLDVANKAGRP
jgi:hypothetical protein